MRPTIVLVHGAFAESASWNNVIDVLLRADYPAKSPRPTRCAASPPTRRRSATWSAPSPGPVVLVGHSYGGAVISNVEAGAGDIRALVYVAAFAPAPGETCLELTSRFSGSTLGATLETITRIPHGSIDLAIARDRFHAQFAADVSPGDAALMAATQRPVALRVLEEPAGDRPLWKEIASAPSSSATWTSASRRPHCVGWPSAPTRGRRSSWPAPRTPSLCPVPPRRQRSFCRPRPVPPRQIRSRPRDWPPGRCSGRAARSAPAAQEVHDRNGTSGIDHRDGGRPPRLGTANAPSRTLREVDQRRDLQARLHGAGEQHCPAESRSRSLQRRLPWRQCTRQRRFGDETFSSRRRRSSGPHDHLVDNGGRAASTVPRCPALSIRRSPPSAPTRSAIPRRPWPSGSAPPALASSRTSSVKDAVVDRGPDRRPRRMSALDGVRERLGHDEIRARLDVRGQPLDADEGAPTPAPTPGSRSCATLTTVPPGSKRPKCVASTPRTSPISRATAPNTRPRSGIVRVFHSSHRTEPSAHTTRDSKPTRSRPSASCASAAVDGCTSSGWVISKTDRERSEPSVDEPYGRTRMIVFPLIRSVELNAATASSRVAICRYLAVPSVTHPLGDLTQLGAIGHDNEVDHQAVGGPRLGRAGDGHQRSSGSNHARRPLPDVAAEDIENQIDVRRRPRGSRSRGRRTPARRSRAPSDGGSASGSDDVGAGLTCELRRHRTDRAGRAVDEDALPARRRPCSNRPCHAVRPVIATPAPTVKSTSPGSGARLRASTTTYSARVPSRVQSVRPNTRWPGDSPVAP